MPRYIDADDVKRLILEDGLYCDTEADKEYSASIIDKIPTADVVEVVRCKDCDRHNGNYCHHPNAYGFSIFVHDDDFCSFGERREDVGKSNNNDN